MKGDIDEITGAHTTGHEWNGIQELNNPIPRAFRIWLWGSIAVCVIMWVLYPSFPYVTGALTGTLSYSSRDDVALQVETGQQTRAKAFEQIVAEPLEELVQDADLRARFEPELSVLYRDNCAACHGRDATGQSGFPNLTDAHWLWSGTPEEIEYTLRVGINSGHPDTRYAEMPAFGWDGLLEDKDLADVTEYVLSLSGQDQEAEAASRGAHVFEENCAACHNDQGAGGYENGAPSLSDEAWIYGGDREAILQTLRNGRAGVMPSWENRLTEEDIRKLTLYLLWQGQSDGS
jgi:cytochrome c oxidase cbb3-type subunit 3